MGSQPGEIARSNNVAAPKRGQEPPPVNERLALISMLVPDGESAATTNALNTILTTSPDVMESSHHAFGVGNRCRQA